MKLWLLEILACPLDKAYPLELTIFQWQNEKETGEKIDFLLEGYKKRQVLFDEMKSPLFIDEHSESEVLLIHDDLIIKPTPFQEYMSQIIEKIKELEIVHDKSTTHGEQLLSLIRSDISDVLKNALHRTESHQDISTQKDILQQITTELELLNLFKYHLDIQDAVIKCPQCGRWYPVFEAIPQMLPDGVRNKEEDAQFATLWTEKFVF